LVSKGETRKAIDGLLEITRLLDEDIFQETALQSAKYEQYKKDERSGTQDAGRQEIRLSRINHALVEIVRRLPDGKPADAIYAPAGNKLNKPGIQKYIRIAVIGVMALTVVAGVVFLPDRNTSLKKDISAIDFSAQKEDGI